MKPSKMSLVAVAVWTGIFIFGAFMDAHAVNNPDATLEIEYVKPSPGGGDYMLVGLNASHKGMVTCRGYDEYDEIVTIDRTYVDTRYVEAMLPNFEHRITKAACSY